MWDEIEPTTTWLESRLPRVVATMMRAGNDRPADTDIDLFRNAWVHPSLVVVTVCVRARDLLHVLRVYLLRSEHLQKICSLLLLYFDMRAMACMLTIALL